MRMVLPHVCRVPVRVAVAMIVVIVMMVVVIVGVSMGVLMNVRARQFLTHDTELRRSNSGANDLLRPDRFRRNRQTAKRATDLLYGDAGVDQRAKHHVSCRTREAIEVQDPHNLSILPFGVAHGEPLKDRRAAAVRLP
jgi:hypothetical protein